MKIRTKKKERLLEMKGKEMKSTKSMLKGKEH